MTTSRIDSEQKRAQVWGAALLDYFVFENYTSSRVCEFKSLLILIKIGKRRFLIIMTTCRISSKPKRVERNEGTIQRKTADGSSHVRGLSPTSNRPLNAHYSAGPLPGLRIPIQAKSLPGKSSWVTPGLQGQMQSLRGGGQLLPKSSRNFFEPRFGHDFSDVRVHTASRAADTAKSLNAKAFTSGKDVVFGPGQYSPATSTGKSLLAHELTHVIQQESTGKANKEISIWKKGASNPGKKDTFIQQTKKIIKRKDEIKWSKTSSGLIKEVVPGQRFLLMNFAINGSKLKKEHKNFLKKIYFNTLTVDPMAKIKIIGHASRTGSRTHNIALSKKRAWAVRKIVKIYTGSNKRIRQVIGLGHSQSVDNNKTVYGRARNRRVEIIVTPWKSSKPVPKLLKDLQKGMKPYTVMVDDFASAPFPKTIKTIAEKAFKQIPILRFDWEGKFKNAPEYIVFDNKTLWLNVMGANGFVFLRSFRENKICRIKGNPSTCERLFPNTEAIMGRALGNTFCHEIGHALGLNHVPMVDNYMWTPALHPLSEKKNMTYKEKVLLKRTLQAAPAKFNSAQLIRMVHRIKEKLRKKKRRQGDVNFE